MIPAASLVAGAFAKPEQQLEGGAISRGAGINLQDVAKLANITDEKQGQAIGLNFLPEASARKYSPEEMALTYASKENAAQGGRIGYDNGGVLKASYGYDDAMGESWEEYKRLQKKGVIPIDMEFEEFLDLQREGGFMEMAQGGRIGYDDGGISTMMADLDAVKDGYSELIFGKPVHELTPDELIELEIILKDKLGGPFSQKEMPKPDRVMAQEGGLMSLGGMEMDLRGGGFVPLGAQEKADDVPARLSKNEFVFTADAVRAAGGGDVDAGADKMYNTMKQLESRVG
jgi:hypothetical protein